MIFRIPGDDVPVRIPKAVVAVQRRQTGIRSTVVQVAEQEQLKRILQDPE